MRLSEARDFVRHVRGDDWEILGVRDGAAVWERALRSQRL